MVVDTSNEADKHDAWNFGGMVVHIVKNVCHPRNSWSDNQGQAASVPIIERGSGVNDRSNLDDSRVIRVGLTVS